jgi:hypothetical protein
LGIHLLARVYVIKKDLFYLGDEVVFSTPRYDVKINPLSLEVALLRGRSGQNHG